MAGHPYEYGVMVEYLTPARLGGSPDFEKEATQASLVDALRKLTNGIPNAIDTALGEGWEINSHSLTFQNEVVIVSIFLQRHRK